MEELLSLPPGFRFHPTDEELLMHYLKNKISATPLPLSIITDVDVYKFNPWELPGNASFGEKEWYFFSPRERKYPNGNRPNRAAASGYWKATGTDKPVLISGTSRRAGVKKVLVFYKGRPPKGVKSDWIMHEYRLTDCSAGPKPPRKKWSLRLDEWVLCRIYRKAAQFPTTERSQEEAFMELQSQHKFQVPPKFDSFSGVVQSFQNPNLNFMGSLLDSWDASGGAVAVQGQPKLDVISTKLNSLKRNSSLVFDNDDHVYSPSFNPYKAALAHLHQISSLPGIESEHAWLS